MMDGRTKRFTFRLTPKEYKMLLEMAEEMERSASDALRFVIRRQYERQTVSKIVGNR